MENFRSYLTQALGVADVLSKTIADLIEDSEEFEGYENVYLSNVPESLEMAMSLINSAIEALRLAESNAKKGGL